MRCFFYLLLLGITLSGCLWTPPQNPPVTEKDVDEQANAPSSQQFTIVDSIDPSATGGVIRILHTGTGSMRWVINEDAPVLRVFIDYGCSYCKKFEEEVKPTLLSTLVQQGRLQLEEVIVPITSGGTTAAGLSLCALDTLAWEKLHTALFRSPTMSQTTFVSIAKKQKVDTKILNLCLKKNMMSLIKSQDTWAKENGVDSVPRSELFEQHWIGLLDTPEIIDRIENILRDHKHGTMP